MPTNLELRNRVKKLAADLNKVAADSTAYSAIVAASGLGGGAEAGAEAGVAQGRYFDAVEIDAGYSRTALGAQGDGPSIDLYLGKPDPNNANAAAGVAINLPVPAGTSSVTFSLNAGLGTFENGTAAYAVVDADAPDTFLATGAMSPNGGNSAASIQTDGVSKLTVVVYMFATFGQATNAEGSRLTIDSVSITPNPSL